VRDSIQHKVLSLSVHDSDRRTPRLRADNYLDTLTTEVDDTVGEEATAEQFMRKVKLIASIHENVLINVEHAQQKQKRTYATRKGK
jgi:hypothetical protein